MPELKLYTVKEIKDWLIHNQPVDGLSEYVIAPQRAWAIANNPYVHDDEPVAAAIFENGEFAAYVCAFPEVIECRRYWWFSALYCAPKYRGKGYGLIVVGSLAEEYGLENCMDRWAAKETIEIFTHFGHKTIYSTRYILSDKKINTATLKGKMAACAQSLSKWCHQVECHNHSSIHNMQYTLKYLPYIDDETYAFMKAHRGDDVFLHSQQMLNWEITYPFSISSPLLYRVEKEIEFTPNILRMQYHVVQVCDKNTLVGVYVIQEGVRALTVTYLYYEELAKDLVFSSIVEHMFAINVSTFRTENGELADFVQFYKYFPKVTKEKISFSYPQQIIDTEQSMININGTSQLGDGDSFA